ncbi:unnamed protein product [Meganyctiphanes norvegica]|uniref:Uncharacterized protein n=1 Tax=Meganyctiphanes norvegica TaxID=48144 RepID=A0AAV2Q765_MEGNR
MDNSIMNPPKFDPEFIKKSFEIYRKEVECWGSVTNIAKSKQGMAVALSLPDDSSIKNKIFTELETADLQSTNGVDKILEYMDKLYLKDDLLNANEMFNNFDDYVKKPSDTMKEYVMEFDRLYRRCEKYTVLKIGDGALGFYLLKKAKLDDRETQLVLTGVDYKNKDVTIYEQMSSALVKFLGGQRKILILL